MSALYLIPLLLAISFASALHDELTWGTGGDPFFAATWAGIRTLCVAVVSAFTVVLAVIAWAFSTLIH